MRKFILFLIILGWSQSKAQVGIGTSTPNSATILDISSTDKGILIPRLTETERNTSLADNDVNTVPPAGVVNTNLMAGTLIFNTTQNRFEFWDGTLWRQLFVTTSSEAGNDGVVRIDGGLNGTKPSLAFGENNGFSNTGTKKIVYTTPLTFAPSPTTSWPETITNPTDADIYLAASNKFRENPIKGQVHLWRLIINLTAGANSAGAVNAIMKNPSSGFIINSIQLIPAGSASGSILTFYFYTIADDQSLDPGRGYEFYLDANKAVTATIESITRVSLFKD